MKINFETKIQGAKVVVNFEGSIEELMAASKLQRTELVEWLNLIDDNKCKVERIVDQYIDIGANLSKKIEDKTIEIQTYKRKISKDEVPDSAKQKLEEALEVQSWSNF